MLIAAVNPVAEAKLDGLNHALTSGQYLPENYENEPPATGFAKGYAFPVLATADSGIGESAVTQVQELAAPSAPPVLDTATISRDSTAARPYGAQHHDDGPSRRTSTCWARWPPDARRACSTRCPRTGPSAR